MGTVGINLLLGVFSQLRSRPEGFGGTGRGVMLNVFLNRAQRKLVEVGWS